MVVLRSGTWSAYLFLLAKVLEHIGRAVEPEPVLARPDASPDRQENTRETVQACVTPARGTAYKTQPREIPRS